MALVYWKKCSYRNFYKKLMAEVGIVVKIVFRRCVSIQNNLDDSRRPDLVKEFHASNHRRSRSKPGAGHKDDAVGQRRQDSSFGVRENGGRVSDDKVESGTQESH